MLVKGYKIVLDWFLEVAGDLHYENPRFERFDFGAVSDDEEEAEQTWANYEEKPSDIKDEDRVVEIEDPAEGVLPKKQVSFAVDGDGIAAGVEGTNDKENIK